MRKALVKIHNVDAGVLNFDGLLPEGIQLEGLLKVYKKAVNLE